MALDAALNTPAPLSPEVARRFWEEGWALVPDAVTATQLADMRAEVAGWVDESRAHAAPFGSCVDGRPRFDMGEEHTAESPALRRINNPSEISGAFHDAMASSGVLDAVSMLLGGSVKHHHCKINLKLPGSATEVGYHQVRPRPRPAVAAAATAAAAARPHGTRADCRHRDTQDFAYTPHTNDDVITALLMLDDNGPTNGALTVVPGSHRGPMYSLFQDDTFTGVIGASEAEALAPAAVPVYGKAGSVCLMHTRLVHGSDANRSEKPRGLFIAVCAPISPTFSLASALRNAPLLPLLARGRGSLPLT